MPSDRRSDIVSRTSIMLVNRISLETEYTDHALKIASVVALTKTEIRRTAHSLWA